MKLPTPRKGYTAPTLMALLLSPAGAIDLLTEDFNTTNGGFVEESSGIGPVPAVYNQGTGTWSMDGDDSGPSGNTLTSPVISVATTAGIQVSFEHRYSIEPEWDGTALQISIDDGPFKTVPGSAFTENPYTFSPLVGNHALTGGEGFNGDSTGYGAGTFITSVANVGGLSGGSSIRVRFLGAWDEGTRGAGVPNWEINSVSVQTLLDTDGDGMPDVYEDANSLNKIVNDAADDPDSDTVSNLDEYLNGTDPQKDDSDDDGLLDGVETNTGTYVDATDTGTDPLNSDTDGDGLKDGAENPALPFVDQDQAGTNPTIADTDNDGFSDGLEVLLSTSDPTNPASRPLRAGLLDILAYWDFNDDSDPLKTKDLIKGFEGVLLPGVVDPAINTVYTPDAGGRTGTAGDKAVDMGTLPANSTGINVELGEIFNIAAQQNQVAISYWQKLHAISSSTVFRAISPSSNGGQRGYAAHAPWSDSNIYFDTVGCCDGATQRISGEGSSVTTLDEWRHVVFQKNGDNKEVWVDGVLVLSGTSTLPLPSDFNRLFIGSDDTGINITGQIDDFAVFADALSSAEIAKLAAGDDPRSLVPSNDDADLDGMPDAYEVANGLNPAIDDSLEDPDNDGADNITEYLNVTDPQNPDTDDDGLKDGAETKTGTWVSNADTGTDPLKNDSDNDGLLDGVEDNGGTFVSAAMTGTNPNIPDTDSDKFKDGFEVAQGTDPNDANSVPEVALVTVIDGLLGGDLTDPEDDGVEGDTIFAVGDIPQTAGTGFNWVSIRSSEEEYFDGFGGGEGAFDIFDNQVGGGAAKWCCGGAPVDATVEFEEEVSLTHFTLTSSNDTPGRDPLDFQIQGSNDGIIFEVIYDRADDVSLWTARNQTVRIDLPAESDSYKFIRYSVTRTGGANHALSEIEYFGSAGAATPLQITAMTIDPITNRVTLTWNSRKNRVYSVFSSVDLIDFGTDIDDSVDSEGEVTTYSFINPTPGLKKLFFRVQENE